MHYYDLVDGCFVFCKVTVPVPELDPISVILIKNVLKTQINSTYNSLLQRAYK